MAKKLRVKRTTYTMFENYRKKVRLSTAHKYLDALGLSYKEFQQFIEERKGLL